MKGINITSLKFIRYVYKKTAGISHIEIGYTVLKTDMSVQNTPGSLSVMREIIAQR